MNICQLYFNELIIINLISFLNHSFSIQVNVEMLQGTY
ncbi:unnamed protein product [Schistosoma mattheei]|uniref:Uncharacterized protein n=1 Tax=Schistosoma mattheei TaxID=31246 RepID=A0A183P5A3_9TREM|nr:unnamed protein product [Schistosoma mattheei]